MQIVHDRGSFEIENNNGVVVASFENGRQYAREFGDTADRFITALAHVYKSNPRERFFDIAARLNMRWVLVDPLAEFIVERIEPIGKFTNVDEPLI